MRVAISAEGCAGDDVAGVVEFCGGAVSEDDGNGCCVAGAVALCCCVGAVGAEFCAACCERAGNPAASAATARKKTARAIFTDIDPPRRTVMLHPGAHDDERLTPVSELEAYCPENPASTSPHAGDQRLTFCWDRSPLPTLVRRSPAKILAISTTSRGHTRRIRQWNRQTCLWFRVCFCTPTEPQASLPIPQPFSPNLNRARPQIVPASAFTVEKTGLPYHWQRRTRPLA